MSNKSKSPDTVIIPDPPPSFVRVGPHVLNLAHVIWVDLPAEGDPKKPLTLHLTTGGAMNLTGPDADGFLAALGEHCDVSPAK